MPKYTAKNADKYDLYQQAVQCPEADVAFIDRVYRRHYGRPPTLLSEDFCGTALIACQWVKRRRTNEAYGVDLHQPTLDWGRKHNVNRLSAHAARRVQLINGNVIRVARRKVHVVGALNFSYFTFKERNELVTYFRNVRTSLRTDGMFVLDAYGGFEAQQVMEEKTKHKGFTYVWDQAEYNPINDHTRCHIHFKFPDGTELKRAFTYDWRLWTLGAIRDALKDAGFRSTEVYWEGTRKDGKGTGVYRRQKRAENTAGWNVYIVALPKAHRS